LRTMNGKLNKCKNPLYDIYESKSQISHKKFHFLQDRTKRATIRNLSRDFDIFRQNAKNPLYDIYESKSRISRRKFNFLQYRAKRAIY
jgi:hypothetical protein